MIVFFFFTRKCYLTYTRGIFTSLQSLLSLFLTQEASLNWFSLVALSSSALCDKDPGLRAKQPLSGRRRL